MVLLSARVGLALSFPAVDEMELQRGWSLCSGFAQNQSFARLKSTPYVVGIVVLAGEVAPAPLGVSFSWRCWRKPKKRFAVLQRE